MCLISIIRRDHAHIKKLSGHNKSITQFSIYNALTIKWESDVSEPHSDLLNSWKVTVELFL